MKIYNYSKTTREYIGEEDAELDPIGNEPMVPAFATADPPPAVGPEQVAIYTDKWEVFSDKRGARYYTDNNDGRVIDRIGQDVPINATLEAPPSAKHILESGAWRTKTTEEINIEEEEKTLSRWKDDPENDALMMLLYTLYKAATGTNPDKEVFWNQVKTIRKTKKFFDF